MPVAGEPLPDHDALVARAREGDSEAFGALHRAHFPRVERLVRWLCGSDGSSAVDDLVQDSFLVAWRALPQLRSGTSFGPWLLRIAARTTVRDRRVRRRNLTVAQEMPVVAAEASILARLTLERGLRQLAPTARKVFVMHEMEDFSHQEIATILGMTDATSRSHLRHAREQLRVWMERHG
jgi:RNA polymerase sigma-70 factor, ECF subfamily